MALLSMPEDWDRAIVVAAHPDDIEHGLASAVARWAGQGKQGRYLLATRGQDGLVEYGIPLRRDLAAAFRKVRPEVVITMSFDLTWHEDGPVNHADHRATGLAVLDACRDAANEWVFPEAGPRCDTIRDAYVAGSSNPTHFVDVTATIDAGVASLRQHQAYIDGLGGDFDPDQFLKDMAGFIGLGADCEYAMAFHRYPMS